MSGHAPSPGWWRGKKVARLPAEGTLLVATDLQGNWTDYCALKALYREEKAQGNAPILLLCGDMVHGPGLSLADPARWPAFLGTYYQDESDRLILDFIEFCREESAVCLMGNHEHAHVGGPVVSKFHPDEAAVLNARLGVREPIVREFLSELPLIAVSPCGVAFSHAAPRQTEATLEDFETIDYRGYDGMSIMSMHESTTLGALLWARSAGADDAQAFLSAATVTDNPAGVVVYGHDVVRDGYERIGDEQLCLSTSFGCDDDKKHYLRLDLSARYDSVHALRTGHELLPLYPEA